MYTKNRVQTKPNVDIFDNTYICDEPVIISPLMLFFDMKFKFYSNICFSLANIKVGFCVELFHDINGNGTCISITIIQITFSVIEKAWSLTNKNVSLLCAYNLKQGHSA